MDENVILLSEYNNIVKVDSGNVVIIKEINNLIKIIEVPELIKVENNEVKILSLGIQGPPGPPGDSTRYIPSLFTYGFGGEQQTYDTILNYDDSLNYLGITPLTDIDKLSKVEYTDGSYKLLFYTNSLLSRIDFYRFSFNNIYRKDFIYNNQLQLIEINETIINL